MPVYSFRERLSFGACDRSAAPRHQVPVDQAWTPSFGGVHKLQARLHELGFGYIVGNINGCYNSRTEDAIKAFQAQARKPFRRISFKGSPGKEIIGVPLRDPAPDVSGLVDIETAQELNRWLELGYYNSAEILLVPYGNTWLSQSMAAKLGTLENELLSQGITFPVHFLGGFRHPFRDISDGMIVESNHCLGSAVDLDEWRGMQNPASDYFYISSDDGGRWSVWMRRDRESDMIRRSFTYHDSHAYFEQEVVGDFLDITPLIERAGLDRIARREGWKENYYLSEWWHLQERREYGPWQSDLAKIGYVL